MEPEYLTVIKSNATQTAFSHILDENKIKNNRKEIRQVCWRHLDEMQLQWTLSHNFISKQSGKLIKQFIWNLHSQT